MARAKRRTPAKVWNVGKGLIAKMGRVFLMTLVKGWIVAPEWSVR